MLILLSLLACVTRTEDGCLDRRLERWCHHDWEAGGPAEPKGDEACERLAIDPADPPPDAVACGEWLILQESHGYSGRDEVYDAESGELVAVRYWKDVNTYCGGFSYTYGRRVSCE